MKNSEIIQFEVKDIHQHLLIVKSFFGYFFIDKRGAQVQNPETKEIGPFQNNELWENLTLNKRNMNPFLKQKVEQIIERFLANYSAIQKNVAT